MSHHHGPIPHRVPSVEEDSGLRWSAASQIGMFDDSDVDAEFETEPQRFTGKSAGYQWLSFNEQNGARGSGGCNPPVWLMGWGSNPRGENLGSDCGLPQTSMPPNGAPASPPPNAGTFFGSEPPAPPPMPPSHSPTRLQNAGPKWKQNEFQMPHPSSCSPPEWSPNQQPPQQQPWLPQQLPRIMQQHVQRSVQQVPQQLHLDAQLMQRSPGGIHGDCQGGSMLLQGLAQGSGNNWTACSSSNSFTQLPTQPPNAPWQQECGPQPGGWRDSSPPPPRPLFQAASCRPDAHQHLLLRVTRDGNVTHRILGSYLASRAPNSSRHIIRKVVEADRASTYLN